MHACVCGACGCVGAGDLLVPCAWFLPLLYAWPRPPPCAWPPPLPMRKYNLETFFHILIWPPLPSYVDTYVCKFCFFPYAIRSLVSSQSPSLYTYIFPPLSLYHYLFLSLPIPPSHPPSQALPTPIPALSLRLFQKLAQKKRGSHSTWRFCACACASSASLTEGARPTSARA